MPFIADCYGQTSLSRWFMRSALLLLPHLTSNLNYYFRPGYTYRKPFLDFLSAFWQLQPSVLAAKDPEAAKVAAAGLLSSSGLSQGADYQLGATKVFIKATKAAYLLRILLQRTSAAAVKVQAAWKGYAVRKQYAELKAAVLVLQTWVRGMLARQLAHRLRCGKAAVVVQSQWRGYRCRVAYQETKAAAAVLQGSWRVLQAKRLLGQLRMEHAALVVQCAFRGWVARQELGRHKAAVVLQAGWRGRQERRLLQRVKAAVVLQGVWRGWEARQQLQREKGALVLQTAWRGQQAQREWVEVKQHKAARVLQAAWRGKQGRRQYRKVWALEQRQQAAAKCIQKAWRMSKRPRFRRDAAAESAAKVIQTIWREREQHNSKIRRWQQAVWEVLVKEKASLVLQCAWRLKAAHKRMQLVQHELRRARFKQQMAKFQQMVEASQQRVGAGDVKKDGRKCASAREMPGLEVTRHASSADAVTEGSSSRHHHANCWRRGVDGSEVPVMTAVGLGVQFTGIPAAAAAAGPVVRTSSGRSMGVAAAAALARSGPSGDLGSQLIEDLPRRYSTELQHGPATANGVNGVGGEHGVHGVADGVWGNGDVNGHVEMEGHGSRSVCGSSSGMRQSGAGRRGSGTQGAHLLGPAAPAAYGVQFRGLPGVPDGRTAAPSSRSQSGGGLGYLGRGITRAVSLQRTLSPTSNALGEEVPTTSGNSASSVTAAEVVKADNTPQMDPKSRLQVRLKEIGGGDSFKGLLSKWKTVMTDLSPAGSPDASATNPFQG